LKYLLKTFFWNSPTSQIHGQIFALDVSDDADSRMMGVRFVGLIDIAGYSLVQTGSHFPGKTFSRKTFPGTCRRK